EGGDDLRGDVGVHVWLGRLMGLRVVRRELLEILGVHGVLRLRVVRVPSRPRNLTTRWRTSPTEDRRMPRGFQPGVPAFCAGASGDPQHVRAEHDVGREIFNAEDSKLAMLIAVFGLERKQWRVGRRRGEILRLTLKEEAGDL